MPKTKFDRANVRGGDTSFPQVKLEHGAIWRVVLAEDGPTYEWGHRLVKPKLSPVDGKLLMRTVKVRGEEVEEPDTDFVGAPRCLGSLDILEDRGVDPAHCPVCAASMHKDTSQYFTAPERKFAVHVLRYGTKGNTAQVVSPLSLSTLVWRLNENRYAKVVKVIDEFGGDPMAVDLVLGACTNAMYQNYEIAGGSSCHVAANETAAKLARDTFEGNNAGDLSPYCARLTDIRFVERDITEIIDRWRSATNGSSVRNVAEPDFSQALGESGAALLDGAVSTPPKDKPVEVDLDDTVGGSEEKTEPAAAEKTSKPADSGSAQSAPVSRPADAGKKSPDFSDLMSQLGLPN